MYKNILFPVDISDEDSWNTAFPIVLDMVKAFGAKLHVMTVVPDYGMSMVQQYFPKGWLEEIITKSTNDLRNIVKANVPSSVEVNLIIGRGAVYQSILDNAEKVGADLIIISASRPGREEYLLGPNTAKVVRHSKISVLVVRD